MSMKCIKCEEEITFISRELSGSVEEIWEIRDTGIVHVEDSDFEADEEEAIICNNCGTPVTEEQNKIISDMMEKYEQEEHRRFIRSSGNEELNLMLDKVEKLQKIINNK